MFVVVFRTSYVTVFVLDTAPFNNPECRHSTEGLVGWLSYVSMTTTL